MEFYFNPKALSGIKNIKSGCALTLLMAFFVGFTVADGRRYTSNEENICVTIRGKQIRRTLHFLESLFIRLVYWRSFLFLVWHKIALFINHYILHVAFRLAVAPYWLFRTKRNISKSQLNATLSAKLLLL